MPHSTPAAKRRKSAQFSKPNDSFPLYPNSPTNPGARWCKKVRGRLHYFGKCADDPKGVAALELWLDQKNDLLAGRTPRAKSDGLTLETLCETFLAEKDSRVDLGELAKRTFDGYRAACQRLVDALGKRRLVTDLRPDDFSRLRATLGKTRGPVAVGGEITVIRMVFKWAYDSELIDKPVRFGPGFKRPSKKTLRIERAKKGKRLFDAEQIHQLIDAAGIPLRTMILLGINCGVGNSDLGKLPISAVDLGNGWIDFPRPKTGIERRCKLWPETVEASRLAIEQRPTPKSPDADGLVFITKYGQRWAKDTPDSPISKEMRKLLDETGIYRPGLSFYALRHTFATVGGATADQVAVNSIMGHTDDSMAAVYREQIADERLEAVADHVRAWLFGEGVK